MGIAPPIDKILLEEIEGGSKKAETLEK